MRQLTKGSIHYDDLYSGFPPAGYDLDAPAFYLNHSCDEWVIGGIEEAKQFAADLLALIAEVEALPTPADTKEDDHA